jgi:guanylate kinase
MKQGPVIIVSGPAGSGKSTLVERAVAEFPGRLRHSVSATSRAPRDGEVNGIHYHFWTREQFERATTEGAFLEYAVVFGRDYYGTPRDEVDPYRQKGIGVILDIDVQGAAQLRKTIPDAFSIFVETPKGEYERRLRARGTDSEESIQRRLQTAREELSRASEFDLRLLNDNVEQAAEELCAIIRRRFELTQ